MSFDELKDIISRLTYKPGFKIQCSREEGRVFLAFRSEQPDATDPVYTNNAWENRGGFVCETLSAPPKKVNIYSQRVVQEYLLSRWSRDDVLRVILEEIIKYEQHEALEFLKLDGVNVGRPHQGVKCILE